MLARSSSLCLFSFTQMRLRLMSSREPPSTPLLLTILRLDFEQLKRAINDKTRAIILNTPHNPTGKVFSQQELEKLAAIVLSHERLIVISDEVYEFIVYEPSFPRICTIPGMFERTLVVSSAAKTFCVTGWKIGLPFLAHLLTLSPNLLGWVYGPE